MSEDKAKLIEEVFKKARYRCERCWSRENLKMYKINPRGKDVPENYSVLCGNCYSKAPRNPFIFKEFFLRFSSPKEAMEFYDADSEEEALKKFCKERGIDFKKIQIEERKLIRSEAIKKGMERCVESRGHAGFNIPYGYDYKDGKLSINEEEAKVVKDIYSWYLSGKSMRDIAEMLNSAKIPTKRGGIWAKKTISGILKNPMYCGYFRREGKITRFHGLRIVDTDTFKKVQEKLKEQGGKPFELPL